MSQSRVVSPPPIWNCDKTSFTRFLHLSSASLFLFYKNIRRQIKQSVLQLFPKKTQLLFNQKYIFSQPSLWGSLDLPGNCPAPSFEILQHSVKVILVIHLTFSAYESQIVVKDGKHQHWSVRWNFQARIHNLALRVGAQICRRAW